MTENAQKERIDLANLSRNDLEKFVIETLHEKKFRANQLWRWLHQRGVKSFDEMTDLSKELREQLQNTAQIGGLKLIGVYPSNDGTRKLVLETWDKHRVESVLIPSYTLGLFPEDEPEDADIDAPQSPTSGPALTADEAVSADSDAQPSKLPHSLPGRRRLTVCFSTQVGCAMDCGFCYTASLGLARNLTAAEITDQMHHARRVLAGDEITNLVAMGMGEPLANLSHLLVALEALHAPDGLAFGARRITISTVGLVPQMKKLGQSSRVNLAVSLTATTDALRDELMPINRKFPLAELIKACREYPLSRGRRITFEYVLLAGVNDSIQDAERLAKLLKGIPAKVNLLPFNEHDKSPHRRPTEDVVERFKQAMLRLGYSTSVRTSRGRDVTAACGQLGHNAQPEKVGTKIRVRPQEQFPA